jgi:hypothetical protein
MLEMMMKRFKKSERGFAMMESLAFMMAFVILTAYCIDLFTIVHTGILGSTASRTYLFETLQHRSNISFLRQSDESGWDPKSLNNYTSLHQRFHAVSDEDQSIDDNSGSHAAGRTLTQVSDPLRQMQSQSLDAQQNQTSTIWIKTGYGICLDSACPQGGG